MPLFSKNETGPPKRPLKNFLFVLKSRNSAIENRGHLFMAPVWGKYIHFYDTPKEYGTFSEEYY